LYFYSPGVVGAGFLECSAGIPGVCVGITVDSSLGIADASAVGIIDGSIELAEGPSGGGTNMKGYDCEYQCVFLSAESVCITYHPYLTIVL
jgi:hypothetical protein